MRNTILSYFILFILFFALANQSFANNQQDFLQKEARIAKIDSCLTITRNNLRTDIAKAWSAAQKAKELSVDFDETKLLEANLNIALLYQQKGVLDSSLVLIKDAAIQYEDKPIDSIKAEIYHVLGLNYQYGGSIELAVESYHKALNINEELGFIGNSMKQLNNIGLLYREEEEYDLALEYIEKCRRVSEANGFEKYEYYSNGNIGYVLMKQEKWEEALKMFEKTLKLNYYQKDSLASCSLNYLISDVKLNLGDFSAAKYHAKKALRIANSTDYAIGKVFSQRVLSEVYLREKKYNKARNLAQKTLDYLQKKSNNLYVEDVLNVLYDIEYETGNYKQALEIHQQLSTRRDSLNQVRTKEKISNSAYKYQILQNEQENQLLKIENDSNQRTSLYAIAIALLLSLLVFSAFYAYWRSKNNNEILEKAIKERTKELENSNKYLAQSNEELERFAYIASHDLKTPLRDIVSFTGLLERQLKDNKNERVHEFLSFIKKGGIRLNNIITDTLEFSKLSAQEENGETELLDLNTFFKDLSHSISTFLKEQNAKLIIQDKLPHIHANESNLVLLFQNLVENGIKYNNNSTPTIKISAEVNSNYLSIFVKDNGIGISEEFKEEIFTMFSRLHTQNVYEGTGLGLSICKKIVEKLKGELHLTSEVNKGSIFEIRLPRTVVD